jgi:hypothetical protein
MSDEVPATFTMPLAGRDIEFRRAGLGQVLVLQRMLQRQRKLAEAAKEDDKGDAMTSVIVRTLDFIDTLVVQEDDRQFIEDQMLAGEIELPDIMGALSGPKATRQADDQAPVSAKRTPKKVAKKTVASRARTKR